MTEPVYVYAQRPPRWYETFTGGILGVNVATFIAQKILDNDQQDFTNSWALSLPGLQEGHWWQLLTFQVIHGGPVHLLVNCLLIYVMGSALESFIGKWRLLMVYILGGVMGGALEMAIKWRWPDAVPIGVVGASAGAMALAAAFATLFPFQRLRLLIFFVIPVAMNARTMLWLLIGFSIVGMTGVMHDNIAHAGHLGGIVWGVLYTWFGLRRFGITRPPPLP